MSSGYFTINLYGQDRLTMDWFGLNDPFTQQVPILITNNWSGTIYVRGQLNSPPAEYAVYSGVGLGSVANGANATLVMNWNVNVSGQIASSSPVTDSLTLGLLAFTSSNYTGNLASGSVGITNVLFNRYSGVIKVFGDDYSNDVPQPSLAASTGGTFASGQTMSYVLSYIKSGWESDTSTIPPAITFNSGQSVIVSWTGVTGVAQYAVWRWSGSDSNNLYVSSPPSGLRGSVDLVSLTTSTSFTDTNVVAVQASLFRHRNWETVAGVTGKNSNFDGGVFFSSPYSIILSSGTTQSTWAQSFFLKKNLSGTSLLGPFYATFHLRNSAAGNISGIFVGLTNFPNAVGATMLTYSVLSGLASGNWYRFGLYISGSALPTSGYATLQINTQAAYIDDVFVVSVS